MSCEALESIGLGDLDLWAVKVVVREGKFMALSPRERSLAAALLKHKGYDNSQIGKILRCSTDAAQQLTRRNRMKNEVAFVLLTCPEVMGGRVPDDQSSVLTRQETRRIIGSGNVRPMP